MRDTYKLDLGILKDKLDRLPYAITIASSVQPDHPLAYVNPAFSRMTGFGDEMLGQNCRFLQSDLENEVSRAEIRESLRTEKRTQVMLQNRRKSGEAFYNLLILYPLPASGLTPGLVIGSQFDLGSENPEAPGKMDGVPHSGRFSNLKNPAQETRLERRRLVTEAAVRLIQSWFVIRDAGLERSERLS